MSSELEDHIKAASDALQEVKQWWEMADAELEAAKSIIEERGDPGSKEDRR